MFQICELWASELIGDGFVRQGQKDFRIYGVSDPEEPEGHSVIFVKGDLSEDYTGISNSIFITRQDCLLSLNSSCVQLKSDAPKNLYGDVLNRICERLPKAEYELVNGSYISRDVRMGENVNVGPFCVIGRDVVIGSSASNIMTATLAEGALYPDRIVVGEVRGEEAIDMLQAMNTGHDGSFCTCHANSTQDTIGRLETMVLMGMELPLQAIRRQIASGIDLIVYLGRLRDKSRRLLEITEVTGMEGDQVALNPLFLFRETGEVSGRICGVQEKTGEMKQIEKFQRAKILDY